MGKWKQNQRREDPDAGWKAIVAELLPEAQVQCDALVASWQGNYPELPSKVIYQQVVIPLVRARYGDTTDQTVRNAGSMLSEQLYKPVLAAMQKARREAERAAEALIDTARPVVATTVGRDRERVGSLAIVKGNGAEADQVLVCIASGYVRGDPDDNRDSGWYSNYAQPNDAERATQEYADMVAKIAAQVADDARVSKMMKAISRHDQAGATGSGDQVDGPNQSLLDALFGDEDE